MPEAEVTTRWPDDEVLRTYSPSLVVHDHLTPMTSHPGLAATPDWLAGS